MRLPYINNRETRIFIVPPKLDSNAVSTFVDITATIETAVLSYPSPIIAWL